jgi:hypothetical protein
MKLPFANSVKISESKLREYLLSDKHPIGRTKARLFNQFGYSEEQWSTKINDKEKDKTGCSWPSVRWSLVLGQRVAGAGTADVSARGERRYDGNVLGGRAKDC